MHFYTFIEKYRHVRTSRPTYPAYATNFINSKYGTSSLGKTHFCCTLQPPSRRLAAHGHVLPWLTITLLITKRAPTRRQPSPNHWDSCPVRLAKETQIMTLVSKPVTESFIDDRFNLYLIIYYRLAVHYLSVLGELITKWQSGRMHTWGRELD